MSTNQHWKWDTGDLRKKKCAYCENPMGLDRADAVLYQDKSYHSFCLLDFLTKFHTENAKIDLAVDAGQLNWGFVP